MDIADGRCAVASVCRGVAVRWRVLCRAVDVQEWRLRRRLSRASIVKAWDVAEGRCFMVGVVWVALRYASLILGRY